MSTQTSRIQVVTMRRKPMGLENSKSQGCCPQDTVLCVLGSVATLLLAQRYAFEYVRMRAPIASFRSEFRYRWKNGEKRCRYFRAVPYRRSNNSYPLAQTHVRHRANFCSASLPHSGQRVRAKPTSVDADSGTVCKLAQEDVAV